MANADIFDRTQQLDRRKTQFRIVLKGYTLNFGDKSARSIDSPGQLQSQEAIGAIVTFEQLTNLGDVTVGQPI